ncbi:nuclear transport factor 2 family protein [Enterococcus sp. AZ109]|uniref:nuclear transport factor 2 family protein n=1 Tax=Enterococcus sp. AZ109 TaxID=2774634 RepID=UPI003F1F1096
MHREVIWAFVEATNQQNIPQIIELMAEDFQFIDTYGGIETKEAMITGWPGYFAWFPDYQIEISE